MKNLFESIKDVLRNLNKQAEIHEEKIRNLEKKIENIEWEIQTKNELESWLQTLTKMWRND